MRSRVILPIVLAAAAGVGCVMLLMPMLKADNGYDINGSAVKVVVANTHLPTANALTENMVRVVDMPADLVPPGAYSSVDEVVGRVLRNSVSARMPIVEETLAPEGRRAGLEGLIEDGYRAKSIKVDEWSAVAHFVKPGSHVDVLSTEKDMDTRLAVPRTILKNVRVLAVGNSLSAPQNNEVDESRNVMPERSVTLMVKPREVEIVVMHEAQKGRLSLALRSGEDEEADDQAYGEFLDAQVETQRFVAEGEEPQDQFTTWVGKGQNFELVTYEKVGGSWYRHSEAVPKPGPQSTAGPRPLPMLRTTTRQSESHAGEKAKLISAQQ